MALKLRQSKPQRLSLKVPASTSNLGPGFDALGLALNLPLNVQWEPAERTTVVRKGGLSESTLAHGSDPVVRGMRRAAILNGKKLPPGQVTVETDFPPGRGLGASGAGLVGGLLLGNRLTGDASQRLDLLREAIELEGHPENATASMLGGAHWSIPHPQQGWIHHPVAIHRELRFVLVIPPYALETRRARKVLPTSVSFARASRQARRTPILLEGLRTLDPTLLQVGIEDELHVGPRLKLLTGAKAVLDFATKAGALATTLSGAGSGLLLLCRLHDWEVLQRRMEARVQRLWGDSGLVLAARQESKGAVFS
ncbi:MAG: hypothetical protein DWQ01_16095 [Planctomycetota bacterium]|nr:MAG: hypothetical protein DWQ01_16095 [Planctomycetota bacterium]